MAKAAEQFRASDVTVWGIIALSVWAIAVLGANVSALVPDSIYGALHASRLEGGTLNQLRTQVAALEEETTRMKRENTQLLQRFAMNEDSAGEVTRRVGAIEVSLPRIVEAQVASRQVVEVDPTATGSIEAGDVVTFEVEGGTVAVVQRPMTAGSDEIRLAAVPVGTPMPGELVPAAGATGLALGFPVQATDAEGQWQLMLAQAGSMLERMSPLLADVDGSTGGQIVAGPAADKAEAIELCGKLDAMGLPCQPVPYAGSPLPMLN